MSKNSTNTRISVSKTSTSIPSKPSAVNRKSSIQQRLSIQLNRVASLLGDPSKTRRSLILFVWSFLCTVLALVYLLIQVPKGVEMIKYISQMQNFSQQMARYAGQAVGGSSKDAVTQLTTAQTNFANTLVKMMKAAGVQTPAVRDVRATSQLLLDRSDYILKNKESLANLYNIHINLRSSIPSIQAGYNEVASIMVTQGAPNVQIIAVENQVLLAEKMLSQMKSIAAGGDDAVRAGSEFADTVAAFAKVLDEQMHGSSALNYDARIVNKMIGINNEFDRQVHTPTKSMWAASAKMMQINEATKSIEDNASKLVDQLSKIERRASSVWTRIIPAAVMLLGLLGMGYALFKLFELRRESAQQLKDEQALKLRAENQRNQTAISRLLDELEGLADGDLSSNATVSEDFTGAIADSINYAIDQLRQLVYAINDTTRQVSDTTSKTQGIAIQLADASEHQSQEIAGVSAAVNEMAVSIDDVSNNAMESASVADRSVGIAFNGGELVRRGIQGMDMIRDQIQETSKRIKRLGESSQEIGNIVSLINDITDQTNILALNAAIQASMAGEAGRGFAVVADEVQRLAERSAFATKEIESLVKTIQSDTNEAVISMELTTTEVVRGARLSKDAGVALEEIQNVSKHLADLILNISNSAKQQAVSASHVANTMNVIQEITSQTTSGTIETARSVGELAKMANALQESVSGFKLPEKN